MYAHLNNFTEKMRVYGSFNEHHYLIIRAGIHSMPSSSLQCLQTMVESFVHQYYVGHRLLSEVYFIFTMFWELVMLPFSGEWLSHSY
jgi:hypothetical protein